MLDGSLVLQDLGNRTLIELTLVQHVIAPGIVHGILHGFRVDIHAQRILCAQQDRTDGEDPRAAAHIDHVDPRLHIFFRQREAQLGGRMGTGAESHARIDPERNAVRIFLLHPGGQDQHLLPDGDRAVKLLPGGHPVLVFNDLEFRFRDLADKAQMPERLADLGLFLFNFIIHRQIAVNMTGAEGGADILGIVIVHAAFHDHTVFTVTGKHFGSRFRDLRVYRQADFQPAFHFIILH